MGDTVDFDEVKRNCSKKEKTLILPQGYEADGEVDIKKIQSALEAYNIKKYIVPRLLVRVGAFFCGKIGNSKTMNMMESLYSGFIVDDKS